MLHQSQVKCCVPGCESTQQQKLTPSYLFFFFFFFFLGYRGIAYSPSARSCRRRQTNLICAHEFTHTATSGSSSARIDRWLVSDSLLSAVSAATVSDTKPGDHYGVTLSLSPAAAPPRGPGVWAMPAFIISHPAFKTLMTTHIQAFFFFFFFFFGVTGELPILRQQEAAADARRT